MTRAATQDRIALRRLKSVFLSSAIDIQTTSGLGGVSEAILSAGEATEAKGNNADIGLFAIAVDRLVTYTWREGRRAA